MLCSILRFICLFILLLSTTASFAKDKEEVFLTIGTGGFTGIYYPAGGIIRKFINKGSKDHGIRASVEATGGTIYNLNSLRAGELDIAFAQSDGQYNSLNGLGVFKQFGPDKKLRSLFSLHSEPFTIIARTDANVTELNDLVGKRVNIGNPGSGTRATMEEIMKVKGWSKKSFTLAAELKASEQAQALCDNKIDVMVYAVGHPNGAVEEVTKTCDTKIISLNDSDIKKLVEDYPYFVKAQIPGGMYSGNSDDIETFGVKATVVTSSDLNEGIVYNIVKAVFDNFSHLKKLHPVFKSLEPEALINEGNSAPLHKGALRYFEENGYK